MLRMTQKVRVNARIGAYFATSNRLDFFLGEIKCPLKCEFDVLYVVIGSDLLYGLGSVNLTPSLTTKLDAFEFKGLWEKKIGTHIHKQRKHKYKDVAKS